MPAPGKFTNGFPLFRIFGVQVYLHWSWLIVAYFEISYRNRAGQGYSSITWGIIEYLALFGIVTLHEFGHALACKSVGGTADRIMLWPLGGVAYVKPPPRPGALLWSIAAGPLVNVVLAPITIAIAWPHWQGTGDADKLLKMIAAMNLGLLIFNLLPFYPLDGGQILRALLWFAIGQANSLLAATIIGLAGAIGFLALSFFFSGIWLKVVAVFAVLQCFAGFAQARRLQKVEAAARWPGFRCPSCGSPPPMGPFWRCTCAHAFDPFASGAMCPRCGKFHEKTACSECGQQSPIGEWSTLLPLPPLAPADNPAPLPPAASPVQFP